MEGVESIIPSSFQRFTGLSPARRKGSVCVSCNELPGSFCRSLGTRLPTVSLVGPDFQCCVPLRGVSFLGCLSPGQGTPNTFPRGSIYGGDA